jgi:tetratricopeptide (TPR) repeat protein
VRITRTPGPVALEAVRGDAAAALTAAPASDGTLVADLTLGAHRGHEIAVQLRAQLGLPASTRRPVTNAVDAPPTYAERIAAGIDAEARGDVVMLEALAHAEQIVEALRGAPARTVAILAPLAGLDWERENVLFLGLLQQGLQNEPSMIRIVGSETTTPLNPAAFRVNWTGSREPAQNGPAGDLIALVPGIVEPELARKLRAQADGLRALPNGLLLVSPARRQHPDRVPRFQYDRLATVAAGSARLGWLCAYAQFYGSDGFLEPSLLQWESSARFLEGGYNIALRLLNRAISCTRNPLQRATCEAALQGLRLNLQRFSEAASSREPSRFLPPQLLGFLLEAKGWGLVMCGDLRAGEQHLEHARAILAPSFDGGEYAYLLNILALGRLRTGDLGGALKLELEIERRRGERGRPDRQLEYVNSINIGRLLRRLDRPQDASHYYEAAFATTLGLRSESDGIYTNLCRAQLAAEQSDADRTLIAWLRAALLWAASDAPEALAPRVVGAILNRGFSAADPEEISVAFQRRLLDHLPGGAPKQPNDNAPVFAAPSTAPPGGVAVGNHGWGVVLSRSILWPSWDGPEHRRLRGLLVTILEELSDCTAFAEVPTIIVDTALGEDMPTSELDLVESSVRLGCTGLVFGGRACSLTRDLRCRLEAEAHVAPASGVEVVESSAHGTVVLFKRYLQPRRLNAQEEAVVGGAKTTPTLKELAKSLAAPLASTRELVRVLESDRVLRLRIPKSAIGILDPKRSALPAVAANRRTHATTDLSAPRAHHESAW